VCDRSKVSTTNCFAAGYSRCVKGACKLGYSVSVLRIFSEAFYKPHERVHCTRLTSCHVQLPLLMCTHILVHDSACIYAGLGLLQKVSKNVDIRSTAKGVAECMGFSQAPFAVTTNCRHCLSIAAGKSFRDFVPDVDLHVECS
jgi:hypothetical protein